MFSAFENKMEEPEYKRKTRDKRSGKALYSITDIRHANKVLKALDKEMVEIRKVQKKLAAERLKAEKAATKRPPGRPKGSKNKKPRVVKK